MTYRERQEARAERLRGWAEKREESAAAVFAAGEPFTSDYAFNTQPGHFPLRARIIAREDRAHESLAKARSMASRADSIEAAAAGAIYSDDPDAVEQLEAKLVRLEAERDRLKAYNASCRRGARDVGLLDESQKRELASLARVAAFQLGTGGQFPAYHLANLGGTITRTRQRITEVRNRQTRTEAAETAGGVTVERFGNGYARVTFAEKPARDVLNTLKAAGYRWGQGSWTGRSERLPVELGGPTPETWHAPDLDLSLGY